MSQCPIARRWPGILPAVVALITLTAMPGHAERYTVDQKVSQQLSEHLRANRLPLVGAQVMENDAGETQVMLYGFVATSFGRSDAEKKARAFLKQPNVKVINRIQVRPEIRKLKAAPSKDAEGPSPQDPNKDPWATILRDIKNSGGLTPPDESDFHGP